MIKFLVSKFVRDAVEEFIKEKCIFRKKVFKQMLNMKV
jgi:hypothetical protein